MHGAWTNMSFAMIHRMYKGSGRILVGIVGIYFLLEVQPTLGGSIHLRILREDEESYFSFKIFIAMERLGACEQWSFWSTTNLEDCSLGLAHGFGLCKLAFGSSVAFRMSSRFARMIYVGNLPADIKEREIEDLFYKYGRILDIELKIPPHPPCYCFVEFDSPQDAEDAIHGRDGYNFDGCVLRVELAHGGRGQPSSTDRRSGYGSGGGGRYGISRHSEYRVIVRGLPSSASWQDLKDHMRKAGDVCFAEVSRDIDGTYGLVDYTNYSDMKYAMRNLTGTEFKNPWARGRIRVRMYEGSPSRGRYRSRSRGRSPSRSRSRDSMRRNKRSPENSLSRSASKSRSPSSAKVSREKSRSRSVSASPR